MCFVWFVVCLLSVWLLLFWSVACLMFVVCHSCLVAVHCFVVFMFLLVAQVFVFFCVWCVASVVSVCCLSVVCVLCCLLVVFVACVVCLGLEWDKAKATKQHTNNISEDSQISKNHQGQTTNANTRQTLKVQHWQYPADCLSMAWHTHGFATANPIDCLSTLCSITQRECNCLLIACRQCSNSNSLLNICRCLDPPLSNHQRCSCCCWCCCCFCYCYCSCCWCS